MHGIIFSELKKYVDTKFGGDTWNTLLNDSGVGLKLYMSVREYPDQEAVALVTAASKRTGKPAAAILEDFGDFISDDLLAMYPTLIKPEWKALEFLENVEQTIHTVVRARNPGAKPAQITCSRLGPNEVVVTYSSPRRMCPVAKGIISGLGRYYKQRLATTEVACMHKGATACKLNVKVV
jgi:predicted hydrocarbon binding protein